MIKCEYCGTENKNNFLRCSGCTALIKQKIDILGPDKPININVGNKERVRVTVYDNHGNVKGVKLIFKHEFEKMLKDNNYSYWEATSISSRYREFILYL